MSTTTNIQDLIEKAQSDGGKLILLYLHRVQNATVTELSDNLHLTLAKTYSILKSLKDMGVVAPIPTSPDRYTLAN